MTSTLITKSEDENLDTFHVNIVKWKTKMNMTELFLPFFFAIITGLLQVFYYVLWILQQRSSNRSAAVQTPSVILAHRCWNIWIQPDGCHQNVCETRKYRQSDVRGADGDVWWLFVFSGWLATPTKEETGGKRGNSSLAGRCSQAGTIW